MRYRNAPLTVDSIDTLDWAKMQGLLPATVQDRATGRVLMLGYMNREALAKSFACGRATFWSRSKQRMWTKGETSGNILEIEAIHPDCDRDALLVLARPLGPTCHLGSKSCFGDVVPSASSWLEILSRIIVERASGADEKSYTRRLLSEGPVRIAQKIGEEGVEVALAAVGPSNQACAEEVADLLYHVAVLMESRGFTWSNVSDVLKARHFARGAAQ
jgi:phosphoribosyl-ATP pyrophosphohydrolase/phosphoribosyl-AMP cyclohydrolase